MSSSRPTGGGPLPRRRARDGWTLVAALALGSGGCADPVAPFDGVFDFRLRFESGDTVRRAVVHVPPSYDGSAAFPLILAFHGSGMDGERMQAFTGLDAVADALGIIVAYPDGAPNWDPLGIRDVRFTRDLIERLGRRLDLDQERVYATGFSAGGAFTLRLACEEADRFAAVGVVAATMSTERAAACRPDRRITTALVIGTVDLLVPIDGDPAAGRLSADSTMAIFARRNGCALSARDVQDEPDAVDDGRQVRRAAYAGCQDGTEVVLWIVEGGNHGWYRGDVDTGRLLGELFLRHRR